MMDCTTARERMLEAEPAELRGEGDSELAAHLRDCATCRARAAAILAAEAEMASALDALAAPRAGARVIPLRPKAGTFGRAAVLAPLAAAAAVAAVLIARPHPQRVRGATADQIARLLFPAPPVARAEAGRSVAVLNTNDPDVTVVWVY